MLLLLLLFIFGASGAAESCLTFEIRLCFSHMDGLTHRQIRQIHMCTHTHARHAAGLSVRLIRGMNFGTKEKCSTSKSREFLTECLNLVHCPLLLPKPFSTEPVIKTVQNNTCVSAHVHVHKGKLLSTSNQGPNQHPIAHPHNLSVFLSSAHLISIPSPPPTDSLLYSSVCSSLLPAPPSGRQRRERRWRGG